MQRKASQGVTSNNRRIKAEGIKAHTVGVRTEPEVNEMLISSFPGPNHCFIAFMFHCGTASYTVYQHTAQDLHSFLKPAQSGCVPAVGVQYL